MNKPDRKLRDRVHQLRRDHLYVLCTGTVQPYVRGPKDRSWLFMCHFGRAEYASSLPVLSASLREQGQAVCDLLNAGEIDETEARKRLGQIYF